MDLDKGGFGFQRVRTYLGPSLGWVDELVQPSVDITTGGVHVVQPGESLLLVEVAAAVIIQLPDVVRWMQQTAYQPATGFDRSITVKDQGGNAANFNIIVAPFGQQAIDNIQQSTIISTARAVVRFVPLIDLSGWSLQANQGGGGGGGGGDVFKAGNNTFTGTNTFNGPITVPTPSVGDNSQNAATTAYVQSQGYITSVSLAPYALIASPIFTGDPKAPTPSPGDNDTSIATTAFVQAAIGAVGSPAPANAEYITSSTNATLTAERVLTNTASITWDFSTPGQAKASTAAGGGNVSSSGTPAALQYGRWTTATTIEGVAPATVRSDIGAQPLDAELTALAGLPSSADTMPYFTGIGAAALTNLTPAARTVLDDTTVGAMLATLGAQPLDADLTSLSGLGGTNTIYYRSAPDIWSPVTFSGMTFSGGVLTVTAGGGNVNNSGAPTINQYARWTDATHIQGVAPATVLTDIGAAPLANPVFTGDPQAPTPLTADNDTSIATTAFVKAAIAATPSSAVSPPQGRLTLQASVPVMVTNQIGKTTIFYTPYVGNQIPIYDGTKFVMTTFTEISVLTTDTAKNPSAIAASKVNDWFVWNDAGTIRLSHGPDWTNDTTRAGTGLLNYIFGLWTNASAITNGPATNRGTYVGTTRSNASSLLDWIYGTIASTGGPSFHGVWNAYNRVNVASLVGDSDDTAAFSAATLINFPVNMKHTFVCGLAEDVFDFIYNAVGGGGTGFVSLAIGYDSTTVMSGTSGYVAPSVTSACTASFSTTAIGCHFANALAATPGGGTGSAWGDAGIPSMLQTGLWFKGRM